MTPRRIQLSRAKGWRKPEGALTVARPTLFGNPWRAGAPATFWLPDYPVSDAVVGCAMTAEDVVTLYRHMIDGGPDPVRDALPAHLNAGGRRWTRDMLRRHAARVVARLPALRGRDLCCWCAITSHGAYTPCHADVLLSLANEVSMEDVICENIRRAKGETL